MNSEYLGLTDGEVTDRFGELFDHHVPAHLDATEREMAVNRLANRFGVTATTLDFRQNTEKRLAGGNITATVYLMMCYLIEKMQTYGLEVDDERIWWHSSRLATELRSLIPLRDELDRREADLAQRETDLAEAIENVEADKRAWERRREEERRQLDEDKQAFQLREEGLKREERRVATEAEAVERERSSMRDVSTRRRIVLEEMEDGGMLEASPYVSLLLAKLALEQNLPSYERGSANAWRARLEKERVFNLLASPIRLVLAIFMP